MHHLIARTTDAALFWVSCAQLAADTQSVIAMRVMGMGGAWNVAQDEGRAMLREKIPAFTEAMIAGSLSVAAGKRPDQVIRATLDPLSDTARLNRLRLFHNGPRLPGLPSPRHMETSE